MMTQRDWLLSELCAGRTMTPRRALDEFGIMRLGARIWELRQEGWPIVMTMKAAYNRFAEPVHFAEYRMEAKDE